MRNRGGIILAGGQSRRMGEDKFFVPFKGREMISYSLELLSNLCDEVIIVGQHKGLNKYGLKVVEDVYPDKGPLGGIYSGLKNSNFEENLVLSCDMPLMSADVFEKLIEEKASATVVIASDSDRKHPLVALYNRSLCENMLKALKENQLKLMDFISKEDYVDFTFANEYKRCFVNINNKEELLKLEQEG